MEKYFIIPKEEIAFTTLAETPDHAMIVFAWSHDEDLNKYFRAVTEDEYNDFVSKREDKIIESFKKNFFFYEIRNSVPNDDIAHRLADKAYNVWCKAGSYPYCDILNEYDVICRVINEWEDGDNE